MKMKDIFLIAKNRLATLSSISFTAKDQGQIDKYTDRPSVKFPCALISVSTPKRKDLTQDGTLQMCNTLITVRIACARNFNVDSTLRDDKLNLALQYYDITEEVDELLQGFKSGKMSPWECTTCVEEMRPDFDVMRFVFSTSYTKIKGS